MSTTPPTVGRHVGPILITWEQLRQPEIAALVAEYDALHYCEPVHISPYQRHLQTKRQEADYERRQLQAFRLQDEIREALKSPRERALERMQARLVAISQAIDGHERHIRDMEFYGVSAKTGKMRPTYQKTIERVRASIKALNAEAEKLEEQRETLKAPISTQ